MPPPPAAAAPHQRLLLLHLLLLLLLPLLPHAARVIGMTATPFRTRDDESLKDVFAQAVWGPSIAELIRAGVLVPPRVIAPLCHVPVLTSGCTGRSAKVASE